MFQKQGDDNSSSDGEAIVEPSESALNFKVIDISNKKKRVTKSKVHYVLDCEKRLDEFKKEFKELLNQ